MPLFGENVPLFAMGISDVWFALPLIVVISLVYAGTRHEAMPAILARAGRVFAWITGFMALAFAVLTWISAGL